MPLRGSRLPGNRTARSDSRRDSRLTRGNRTNGPASGRVFGGGVRAWPGREPSAPFASTRGTGRGSRADPSGSRGDPARAGQAAWPVTVPLRAVRRFLTRNSSCHVRGRACARLAHGPTANTPSTGPKPAMPAILQSAVGSRKIKRPFSRVTTGNHTISHTRSSRAALPINLTETP